MGGANRVDLRFKFDDGYVKNKKIRRISNLLETFEVRTLSNSNVNFVTSLLLSSAALLSISTDVYYLFGDVVCFLVRRRMMTAPPPPPPAAAAAVSSENVNQSAAVTCPVRSSGAVKLDGQRPAVIERHLSVPCDSSTSVVEVTPTHSLPRLTSKTDETASKTVSVLSAV